MTDSFIEINRIPLSDEEKSDLTECVAAVKSCQERYGQVNFHIKHIEAQKEEVLAQVSGVLAPKLEMAAAIEEEYHKASADINDLSQELMTTYKVDAKDTTEGIWSLNVLEGCFIQSIPAPPGRKKAKKKKSTRKSPRKPAKATKNSTRGKRAPIKKAAKKKKPRTPRK